MVECSILNIYTQVSQVNFSAFILQFCFVNMSLHILQDKYSGILTVETHATYNITLVLLSWHIYCAKCESPNTWKT